MNLVRPLLSAVLLGSPPALHAAHESGSQAPASSDVNQYISADGTPRYDRWIREFYDSRFRLITDSVFSKQKHKFSGRIVASQLRMWEVTGDESYLRRGCEQFALMMEFAPGNDDILADCFGFYPVVLAGKLLKQSGQFDPAWEQRFHACVVGGMPYPLQIARLHNADLVVATPGRLLDLQRSKQLH